MSEDRQSPATRKRPASDDENDKPRQQFKRRYDAGYHFEIRLLLQSHEAGTIIGRNGENIKRLRERFSTATIQVSDNRGPERMATLGGELPLLTEVLKDILISFEQKDAGRPGRRPGGELRMLIHQSQAGCVIGKGGSKLRDMRQEFDVELKVYAACCPMSTDRIVKVFGNIDRVVNCIISIVDLLRTWPPKGFVELYDPANADPTVASEYGGHGGTGADEGGRGGGGGGRGGGRFGGGGGGGDRFSGRDQGPVGGGAYGPPAGGYGPPGGAPYGAPPAAPGPAPYGAVGPGPGMGMPGMGMAAPGAQPFGYPGQNMGMGPGPGGPLPPGVTSQQVSIPADLAGVIIGKGGQRIKQIRVDSGADIGLNDPTGIDHDRIITITGTLQQIQTAQYMLQMTVKQHLGTA